MAKDVRIEIPTALEHQVEPLASEARFKVWRWGRRTGKTAAKFIASAVGHGAPASGEPKWPGFLNGGKVFWVSRDNTQMKLVWRRDIRPRFKGKPFFRVNEQDLFVEAEFPGGGLLDLRSFENIDSLRGEDADIVVIDEAAHFDLQYAWQKIIRPMLVDREGSAIISSTSKMGSWFNELCELVRAGEMPDSWAEWYKTPFDNPKLDPDEIRAMIDEYPLDSIDLEQEVWAKLVAEGGLAFREWRDDIHVYDFEPPDEWGAVACLDWGYSRLGWFGYARTGFDEELYFRWEKAFKETPPYEVGYEVGTRLQYCRTPDFIVADSAMWQRTQGPVTIAEHFERGLRKAMGDLAPPLVQSPKGPESRVTRKILMHEALRWTEPPEDHEGPLPAWLAPRLRFHSDCGVAISSIPKLPVDERDTEKVETKGVEDDPFDAVTYLLTVRAPAPIRPESRDPDMHPGFKGKKRKRPWMRPNLEPRVATTWQDEIMWAEEQGWH